MEEKTVEDYLKAIYSIYEGTADKSKGIKSIEIVNTMKIKKPSVSAMIKNLADEGYIEAKPYSPVFFTKKGLKKARIITHNHRVIEYFLTEVLKCGLDVVHNEAHKLEHAFSDETIKKLDKYLGNPKVSPYGKRIH
jgi:DtxR family transcriptional regulator, Mn-dependent transcriptional regulator